MIVIFKRRARPARRAKQLRLPGYSGRPFARVIMDRRPGIDRVILAVEAVSPIGIDAVISALGTDPPARRHPIRKAAGNLDGELFLSLMRNQSGCELLAFA